MSCSDNNQNPEEAHKKRGGKLLKRTSEIVQAYLGSCEKAPTPQELETVITTVFNTLKNLKKEIRTENHQ